MPKIVGILNITPNSFSDGGKFLDPQKAINHALQMLKNGADIIDIGGESTAPHNDPISTEEEWNRIEPVLSLGLALKIPFSLDSYKAEIWEKFLKMGGNFLNDVSGLSIEQNEKIALLQQYPTAKVVIMFSHFGKTLTTQNVMPSMITFFKNTLETLHKKNIVKSQVILDPGMGGFLSTDSAVSFAVLENLSQLLIFDCPLLVGTSRKNFLKTTLSEFPEDRDEASVQTSLLAIQNGASFVRIHNVEKMKKEITFKKKFDIIFHEFL